MSRLTVALIAAISIAAVTGCGKPSEPATADGLAQRTIEGIKPEKIDLEDTKAADFLAPKGVSAGTKDVAHMTSNVGAITIYQYDDEASAEAAMEIWKTGRDMSMPIAMLSPGKKVDGVEADDNVAVEYVGGTGSTPYLAARKGAFVVAAFGSPDAAPAVINAVLAGVDDQGMTVR